MEDLDLITRIKADHKDARRHSANWRSDTRENYAFVAGGLGQWETEDVNHLRDQERPIITFNRIGPYIDAISGNEVNSRHTISFLPRTIGDRKINEIYTAAVKWVRDNCNAEDEESDAFVDVLISGMGWMETAMEYDEEPDGKIVLNRIDPGQMYWDSRAKKRNLEDRRWQSRIEWMTQEELDEKWPDKDITPGTTPWLDDPMESGQQPHNASLAFLYRNDATGTQIDDHKGEFRVMHYQWWEHATIYRVADPNMPPEEGQQKLIEFSEKRWKNLQKAIDIKSLDYVKQKRKTYYQAFVCGDTVLEQTELKCKDFTFKAITGKRDKIHNTWYGLVHNMKDPQRWANKFFSQILHIINSNAKGGLMAEIGAFVDSKKAEEQWADPQAVILLKNGGLAKVKEREAATYPQGLDRLMNFAVGSIPAVSGINLETIGMADREQAGILEQERKKSTFTILAPFFDSLRRYRKEEGRLLFHFINEYISDGRLIRVENDQGEQWVPLTRQDSTLEYDIIVDESPSSPNQKQEVWQTMERLIPSFLKEGIPLPPDFFDYSPLPSELADKMKASMSGKLPPKVQEAMQKMQQEIQVLTQQNQQLKNSAEVDIAKLHSRDTQTQLKADVSMEKIRHDYAAEIEKLQTKNQEHIDKLNAQAAEQIRQFQHERDTAILNDRQAFEAWKVKWQDDTKIIIEEIAKSAVLQAAQIAAAHRPSVN